MGLRFLYKMWSKTKYTESLNTLDDREDQNYEENERSIKPSGVYLRKLEQRYMEKQKEIEEINQSQQPPCLIKNILFWYERKTQTQNSVRESSTSYNLKEITVITRKSRLTDQKAQEGN